MKRILIILVILMSTNISGFSQTADAGVKRSKFLMFEPGCTFSGAINGFPGGFSPSFRMGMKHELKHNLEIYYGFNFCSFKSRSGKVYVSQYGFSAEVFDTDQIAGVPIEVRYALKANNNWTFPIAIGLMPAINHIDKRVIDYKSPFVKDYYGMNWRFGFALFLTNNVGFLAKGEKVDVGINLSSYLFLAEYQALNHKPWSVGLNAVFNVHLGGVWKK